MYISPLQQARCSDRSQISSGPEPQNWIAPSLPDDWRLVSFHFFVDWNSHPPVVADQIWMTRQLRFDSNVNLADVRDSDMLDIFNKSSSKQEFDDLEMICSSHDFKVAAILLPEIQVSAISDQTPVWVIWKLGSENYKIAQITISNLKNAIQKHSGGPVWVGSKGLMYGTSAVECYLSESDAAFPGDADAVIVDSQNRVRCVIEYKKHTLSAPIGEHLMTKYYKRDRRKYQRLNALAKRYEKFLQQSVPLVVLYYSSQWPIIRLQEIGSLDNNSATISRDTGDIVINGWSQKAISDCVVRWLKVC